MSVPASCVYVHIQVVGCDGKLYSSKSVDKCGICGGNGDTCYRISGSYRKGITQLGISYTTTKRSQMLLKTYLHRTQDFHMEKKKQLQCTMRFKIIVMIAHCSVLTMAWVLLFPVPSSQHHHLFFFIYVLLGVFIMCFNLLYEPISAENWRPCFYTDIYSFGWRCCPKQLTSWPEYNLSSELSSSGLRVFFKGPHFPSNCTITILLNNIIKFRILLQHFSFPN